MKMSGKQLTIYLLLALTRCVLSEGDGCPLKCSKADCDRELLPDCGTGTSIYPYVHEKNCRKYTECISGKEISVECASNQYAKISGSSVQCITYDDNNPPSCIASPKNVCQRVGYLPDPDDCKLI
uniref:Chitin-binding type-2 domain-containing protein n=1 Tax=Megaselia scalaris TaxID=36166 RepID=T1GAI4_MEGSC